VYEPAGVAAVVVTVRALDPDPVTVVGLKDTVAPAGNPVTLNPTVPLKPAPPVTVVV
jgi:hypothetical protein